MTSMQLREVYGYDTMLPTRFWSKVDTSGDCWLWRGAVNTKGYGHLGITRNKKHETPNAQRISYLLTRGEIDDKLSVLHHCDNPSCVNPSHLFAGTITDNNNDSVAKGRWNTEPRIKYGEDSWRAKLSNHDAFMIKAREFLGERQTWLGIEYGVDSPAIWKMCNGYSWKWLHDA